MLQFGENQKSILIFSPKLWNFENSENIKSESHNNEKMAVTEKEPYFNIIEMNFQKSHKYLKNFFERVLPKNVIFD